MSVFICDKDTLAVLDKFLAGFYVSNKVNFQNYFANKLIKWFVFEAVQNTRSTCFIRSKTRGDIKPDKTLVHARVLNCTSKFKFLQNLIFFKFSSSTRSCTRYTLDTDYVVAISWLFFFFRF